MTLGEKIRKARKDKKLTQKELAEKIGAAHNSISNWENDQNYPDIDTIQHLCWALDVPPSYFLGKDEPATDSGDLAEYLEDLRERPETRGLLEASRGMTKEQVDAMADMLRKMRGTTDD